MILWSGWASSSARAAIAGLTPPAPPKLLCRLRSSGNSRRIPLPLRSLTSLRPEPQSACFGSVSLCVLPDYHFGTIRAALKGRARPFLAVEGVITKAGLDRPDPEMRVAGYPG
jgi:hypothetical protein